MFFILIVNHFFESLANLHIDRLKINSSIKSGSKLKIFNNFETKKYVFIIREFFLVNHGMKLGFAPRMW